MEKLIPYHRWDVELERLDEQALLRRMIPVDSPAAPVVTIDGREKLLFCSNNYLGLANHPTVIAAARQAISRWGMGAGSARLISGTMLPHTQLEQRVAKLLNKQAALVLPSGYAANHAVFTALAQKGDLIAVDKLVHASIIDGARATQATLRTWPHRRLDKLERLLERSGYEQAFIVTDSLFSMDGDIAPLAELVELKQRFGALLIVDEAHAFGCMGPDGRGCAAEAGVLDDIDVLVVTLSKALGSAGGMIAADQVLIDTIVNKARGFIFTTAIPAVNCIAAEAALDIIAAEPDRRHRLEQNAEMLRRRCRQMGLDIGPSQSYIVPIILGPSDTTTRAAQALFQRGLMVAAIRPPTVAPGTARLRISLMSEHTPEHIDRLCTALADLL